MNEKIKEITYSNVYGVWGSHEFGVAMAYFSAKNSGRKTVLVDLDILLPSIDVVMHVPRNPLRYEKKKSGMDLVYETIDKGVFVPELINEFCISPYTLKNFYMLTGFSDIEQYEFVELGFVEKLIDILHLQFDEVFLLVNDNPYDAITAYVMSIAKFVFRCAVPSSLQLRYYNNIAMLFNKKQDISFSVFKFVADCNGLDYLKGKDMQECTFGGFIGNINLGLFREGNNSRKFSYEMQKILEKVGFRSLKRKGELFLKERAVSC